MDLVPSERMFPLKPSLLLRIKFDVKLSERALISADLPKPDNCQLESKPETHRLAHEIWISTSDDYQQDFCISNHIKNVSN